MRIVIPVYDQVDTLDVCGPCEMFHWAKFQVDLVAEKPGEVRLNSGLVFQVTAGLGSPEPADALWVPGGEPSSLVRIRRASRSGSVRSVKARCFSPQQDFSMAFTRRPTGPSFPI